MGSQYNATCLECGHRFTLHEGGGMSFAQLRCNRCGRGKNVDIYLHEPGMPTSADDWGKRVESRAGKCKCGGKFTLGAKARCPKCKSTELDKGQVQLIYD